MKHVFIQVADQKLLKAVKLVLQSRDDLVVTSGAFGDHDRCMDQTTVVLTDLSQADELLHTRPSSEHGDGVAPVVVITTPANEQRAVQALREGATSYVPGKFIAAELSDTLDSVFAVAHARHDRSRIMECIARWETEFVLENDRNLIGPMVRYFQECSQRMGLFDRNQVTRMGIALEEALINSMYHGNLEVSSSLREEDESQFYATIEARRFQAPYASRRVFVRAQFSRHETRFLIKDEGPGFDIRKVPDPTAPANVERVCGRGLLLMRTFMDQVEFNEVGNQVQLTKRSQLPDASCGTDES